jgi:hypothetical protein
MNDVSWTTLRDAIQEEEPLRTAGTLQDPWVAEVLRAYIAARSPLKLAEFAPDNR